MSACVPDEDGGCIVQKCIHTPKGECDKFNELFPSSRTIKCVEPENPYNNYCEEKLKLCEEFKYDECRNFYNPDKEYNIYFTKDAKRCIPKEDQITCEIKRCSELDVNEYNRVNVQQDEGNQCIPKKDNSGCEIKTCEERTVDDCEIITNEKFLWKCIRENDKCVETMKTCFEIPLYYCEIIYKISGLIKCKLNKSKTKCIPYNFTPKEDEESKKTEKRETTEKKEDEIEEKENNRIKDNNNGINFLKVYFFSLFFNLFVY